MVLGELPLTEFEEKKLVFSKEDPLLVTETLEPLIQALENLNSATIDHPDPDILLKQSESDAPAGAGTGAGDPDDNSFIEDCNGILGSVEEADAEDCLNAILSANRLLLLICAQI